MGLRSIAYLLLPLLVACAASAPPVVEEGPSLAERRTQAAAHLEAAERVYGQGDFEGALDLAEAALQVFPTGYEAYAAKWTYLDAQRRAGAVGDSAAVGQIEADLSVLAAADSVAALVPIRDQGYEKLYAWTGKGAHRVARQTLLEDFLRQRPADPAAPEQLAKLQSLLETPEQAKAAYQRLAASAAGYPIGHHFFRSLARLAVDHPEVMDAQTAEADFSAWADHLEQAPDTRWQSQYFLWRAEYQLRRYRDGPGAAEWLKRAEAGRSEAAVGVHARLHLLVGDQAQLAGADSRARANYEAAWELAKPHVDGDLGADFDRAVAALRQRLKDVE